MNQLDKSAPNHQKGIRVCLNKSVVFLSLFLAGLTVFIFPGCRHEHVSRPNPVSTDFKPMPEEEDITGEPAPLAPLEIDMDDPLLLDDAIPVEDANAPGFDNAACLVCHMNFDDEPLARNHANHGIGCVTCHGDSFAHRNDENNITPPDVMFPAHRIDAFCQECHKTHDVPAKMIISHWQMNEIPTTDPDAMTCTHCHGKHRMKVRTVIWDKTTGMLLPISD